MHIPRKVKRELMVTNHFQVIAVSLCFRDKNKVRNYLFVMKLKTRIEMSTFGT